MDITNFTEKQIKDLNDPNRVFGEGASEAWAKGLCIECREPALPKCYSGAGRKEFKISGLCEQCFDKLFDY